VTLKYRLRVTQVIGSCTIW